MVFHWSLSDSKSPQVFQTLLSILADLNNAVVWTVSTRPPSSKSSSPFSNPLVTVPNAPITIGIIVIFLFHSFFQFSSKVEVLIFLFTFFQFYSVVSPDNFANSLFLLIIIWSGLLAEIRWSVCMLSPIIIIIISSSSCSSFLTSFSKRVFNIYIYIYIYTEIPNHSNGHTCTRTHNDKNISNIKEG